MHCSFEPFVIIFTALDVSLSAPLIHKLCPGSHDDDIVVGVESLDLGLEAPRKRYIVSI